MNKQLNNYVSREEIFYELDEMFHYRLAKMLATEDIKYEYEYNISEDTYSIKELFGKPIIVDKIVPICKWNYISYLQNNGIQKTYIEMYILKLTLNIKKLVKYQLMNNISITTCPV